MECTTSFVASIEVSPSVMVGGTAGVSTGTVVLWAVTRGDLADVYYFMMANETGIECPSYMGEFLWGHVARVTVMGWVDTVTSGPGGVGTRTYVVWWDR